MSDLTEAAVRGVVGGGVTTLQGDIRRLESAIAKIEGRLGDLHHLQSEMHRMVSDVTRLQDQLRNMPSLYQWSQHVQVTIEEIRARAQRAEESARYTAGYVAMRLKERYDSGVDT